MDVFQLLQKVSKNIKIINLCQNTLSVAANFLSPSKSICTVYMLNMQKLCSTRKANKKSSSANLT